VIGLALSGLRARRRRVVLAALGIAAASIVVGTCATVGFGLATGFERAAERADLPDVIARFEPRSAVAIDGRVSALPNLRARSYRLEVNRSHLRWGGHETDRAAQHVLLGGRRGYAIVDGRDLRPDAVGEVVIEQGLARDWGVSVGDTMAVGRRELPHRVVGIALSPDNVAYPLARAPRVYVTEADLQSRIGDFRPLRANVALMWLNDRDRADVTLTQARATSFGIGRLTFVTRAGVAVLLDQAAGIVIALLVAFSVVALVAAATMLAAGAHAEVQRRLPALGVQRAVGFTPGRIAALQAVEAALVALPAGALGIAVGALAVAGPADALLAALNEVGPGAALLPVLAGGLAAVVAIVVTAATWPAWRAARRSPATILRGGDVSVPSSRRARGGFAALGARFATAGRARWIAAVSTIGVCAAIVTLMLALASLLERLRDDPGTLGKRYQVTAQLPYYMLDSVRVLPGVAEAQARYSVDAADSFRLGEPLRLVAFPGDHTRFEAPPLAEGRRLRGTGEAEVGAGLADALGLRPGSVLAAQLPSGGEVRFRVSGVVRGLENDGRIAWVRPDRLLAADRDIASSIAIRLNPGADRGALDVRLRELGATAQRVAGATTRNGDFLGVLAAVLRGVGLAVGLVCLYALVQALAMTARERRGAVALLRATGADARTVALVLGGAAAAVALPAALAGVALARWALAPLVGRLAAGFAAVSPVPSAGQSVLVVLGLAALGAAATALVGRRVMAEPVVRGLRDQ
jgi:ABC-type antimicrobial peptide transport system permease subunit